MLTEVADGVWTHQSELLRNNSVVVRGDAGVLLVDPGLTNAELTCLADDLRALGLPVVAAFATHPDWDHALWHPVLGEAPRYGTAGAVAFLDELFARPDWRTQFAEGLPPEIADDVPVGLFGRLTALPAGATQLPWDGPAVRVIEHPAHAQGHAALLLEDARVLVAGDMLSDILPPMPDPGAADPLGDYLAGLQALESVTDQVDVVIPGHGSPGRDAADRITQDRAYVQSLRDGAESDDPRTRPDAAYGGDWLPDMAAWQREMFGGR